MPSKINDRNISRKQLQYSMAIKNHKRFYYQCRTKHFNFLVKEMFTKTNWNIKRSH